VIGSIAAAGGCRPLPGSTVSGTIFVLRFIAGRFALSLLVLFAATVLIFFSISSIGDPLGELRTDPYVSEEAIARLIESKHLDQPLFVQYGYWLQDLLFNQFGTDLRNNRPIWPELSRAFVNTAQLVVLSELLAVLIAIVVGVLAGRFQYSAFDHLTTIGSFLGYSIPIFWLALILQILAVNFYEATGLRLVYLSGLSSTDAGTGWAWFVDRIQHLALPVIVLAVTSIATYSRYLRASMLEVVNSDYVRTARAKGLDEVQVTMGHALRNAVLPLATVIGVNLGNVVGGAIIIETVFNMPGMGLYFFEALSLRDIYPLMGWLVVTAALVLIINFITDLTYGLLDPRVKL